MEIVLEKWEDGQESGYLTATIRNGIVIFTEWELHATDHEPVDRSAFSVGVEQLLKVADVLRKEPQVTKTGTAAKIDSPVV